MNMVHFDPIREMRDTEASLKEEFGIDGWFGMDLSGCDCSCFSPNANSWELGDTYHLEVDIPGIAKEDVYLDVKDNMLIVSGERKLRENISGDNYRLMESGYGKFSRSFGLPDNVDLDHISAHYGEGVLEVTIPKMGSASDRSIMIS